jgi:nucleotide-binding universal stress UspA family protein
VTPSASIVCGVDHSGGARAAARFAAALADRLALSLVLVHVVQPPIPQSELGMAARRTDWDVVDELRRSGASLLEEVAQEVGEPAVVAELMLGDASDSLAAAAEQARAELLVVGSRGLGSFGALVLGSVSLRLAVHAPCPTIIVPESGGTIDGAPILCAVDDGDAAQAAITVAATLADRLDVKLVLAHAEPDAARGHEAQELLARLVVEAGLGTAVERMVVEGDPAEAVVEAATGRGAGMIVIGSRGRRTLATAVLGSVSSAVATRAPCPVAIVRVDTSAPTADD